jgi:hypothetical protein
LTFNRFKFYDINQFIKKTGLKCIHKHIEWLDSTGMKKQISCFDTNNQYKGLFAIIIWNPKYHCELNHIKGYWCNSKYYVRKYNTQDNNKLNNFIIEAFEQYEKKKLNIKLLNRFWNAIEMYSSKSTYQNV